MNESIKISSLILMGASFVVLILEAIEKKSITGFNNEKPHIRLFANGAIAASFLIIFLDLYSQTNLFKMPEFFLGKISSIFLIINTAITVFLVKKTLHGNQNGELFFLLLSSLAISITNVCTDLLSLKFICSIGWLLIMTTLAVKTTSGAKKSEIGLKLSFSAIILTIMFIISLYFTAYYSSTTNLAILKLEPEITYSLSYIGIIFFALTGLNLCGIPPFHFGQIDAADGGNTSVAFLLISSSIIQGTSHLFAAKNVLAKSGFFTDLNIKKAGLILAIGFLILWLRALDQRSIRRTITYVACSSGPLFALGLLFGNSIILSDFTFYIGIFSFLTLSLFTLYGSLDYMSPINLTHHTWEDMSGFGRKNKIQTLYFLVAIASISGLPGTLGYFLKFSLIGPMKESLLFNSIIFLSIAMGAACSMRIFVFAFSKHSHANDALFQNPSPPIGLLFSSSILIALGFFPFVR